MAQAKKHPVGDSAVTMEDLAKIAGVSTITVSRALRDSPLVTENTREKIRKIAQEQGYRFNISARNLRMRRQFDACYQDTLARAVDSVGHASVKAVFASDERIHMAGRNGKAQSST